MKALSISLGVAVLSLVSPATRAAGGESCMGAPLIPSLPYSDQGTTSGFVDDYDAACPYESTAPDVVYAFQPVEDVRIDITLCVGMTDYDTKLFVYENICEGVPLACNDDACSSPLLDSYVSALWGLELTAGHMYYIVVDGFGGESGAYQLDVAASPPPPQCPQDSLDGQLPTEPNGEWLAYTSDTGAGLRVYDNYSVTADICAVEWWGLDMQVEGEWVECDLPAGSPFVVEFYPDVAGKPGGTPLTYDVTATGTVAAVYDGFLLKHFQATLTPCASLHAGWLAVQGDSGTACWLAWMSATGGDGQAFQGVGSALSPIASDLAFCLLATGGSPCVGWKRSDGNCDGKVDAFDIDPFVLALTDAAQWAAQYTCPLLCVADCNCDGKVDAFDIDSFVACLIASGCDPCP